MLRMRLRASRPVDVVFQAMALAAMLIACLMMAPAAAGSRRERAEARASRCVLLRSWYTVKAISVIVIRAKQGGRSPSISSGFGAIGVPVSAPMSAHILGQYM